MINVEYKAKVLPDGHLSCPEGIKKKLRLSNGSAVKVIIVIEETPLVSYKSLSGPEEKTGFCGIWHLEYHKDETVIVKKQISDQF